MLVFEDLGTPLTHQKITPGNTITSLSKTCYQYTRYKLNFDDGDTAIVAGDWITGASSGAIAKVVTVNADTSTWTNNTGNLILDSWTGTAFTDNEEIKVGAGSTMANVNGVLIPLNDTSYDYKGFLAKAALVVVYANTALVGFTGGKPDQTALIGTPMVANSSIILRGYYAVSNFKCVDYTASSASVVNVDFYF